MGQEGRALELAMLSFPWVRVTVEGTAELLPLPAHTHAPTHTYIHTYILRSTQTLALSHTRVCGVSLVKAPMVGGDGVRNGRREGLGPALSPITHCADEDADRRRNGGSFCVL